MSYELFFLLPFSYCFKRILLVETKFQISWTGLKVPFWQFSNFSKMVLFNPCMTFEFFFCQKHFFEELRKWKWEKIFIVRPRVRQIKDLFRKKYKKEIFLKALRRIEKFLLFYVQKSNTWKSKLEAASLFDIYNPSQAVL